MAYNSSKGPRQFGDLIDEDDPDTQLDWENDYIGLKTGGTTRFVVSGSNIGVGLTNPAHLLDVAGNMMVSGNAILGTAADDTTTISGQLTASHGLKVSGGGEGVSAIDLNATAGGVKLTAGLDNAASIHLVGYGMTFDGGDENDSFLFNNSALQLEQISAPSSTTNKLYNVGGTLTWNGTGLGGGGAITTYNNPGNNRIITSVNGTTVNSETNLTFDGSNLVVNGVVSGSGNTHIGGGLTVLGSLGVSGSQTFGNAAADVTTVTGQLTASNSLKVSAGGASVTGNVIGSTYGIFTSGIKTAGTLGVSGSVTLGDAAADVTTVTGQLTASHGLKVSGEGLMVANGIDANLYGDVNLGNAASDITTVTGQLTASNSLEVSAGGASITGNVIGSTYGIFTSGIKTAGTLGVSGSVTLGDATSDVTTVTGQLTGSHGANFSQPVGIGIAQPKVQLDVHHDPTLLPDNSGGGEVVKFGTGTLTAGKLYYLHTTNAWTETDADAVATGGDQLLGIALGSSPGSDGVLLRGYFDATTYLSNFSAGKPVYMSTTAASMDTTAPSATGDIVRVIGYCTTNANVIYFNPASTYVEL